MSDTPTPLDVQSELAEFTTDESQSKVDYESLTSAQRQVLILESLDSLHGRLTAYDQLLDGGIESINKVMQSAENNPMIRNILGL